MAITQTPLTASVDSVGRSSYTTATITPSSNRLVLLAVKAYKDGSSPNTPTVTGNGLTWVQVATRTFSSVPTERITLFRAMGASPSSGGVTISFGGQVQDICFWAVSEFGGVDTTGTNGSGAVVQSATNAATSAASLTVTLSAFGSADNATFGTASHDGVGIAPGSGFTEIHEPGSQLQTQWKASNDTTVDWSNGSQNWGGIAVEIKASGLNVTPDHIASTATVHAPTVLTTTTVVPDAIASATTVHAPTVTPVVTPDHIAATTQVHAPAVTRENEVIPDHIASTAVVHAPTITTGQVTVTPDHIGSTAQVYSPSVTLPQVWEFRTPARITEPVGDHPILRRIFNYRGVALVKHADGSWAEYDTLPDTIAPNADYMFGRTDRSSTPRGKGFAVTQDTNGANLETPEEREYQSPQRLFLGGHVYTVSDELKAELESVVTEQEPTGYGSYITAVEGSGMTEDEIALSGYHHDHEQGTVQRPTEDGV